MNLELLEAFGQNFPEEFDGVLEFSSYACTAAFNRRGTLLAVGCNDGKVVIVDFVTRGTAKVLSAHVHAVSSVSWSRNGRKLLSASADNTAAVWDVMSGDCEHRYRFSSGIMKAQFNPRDPNMLLVCPLNSPVVLVKRDRSEDPLPADDELGMDLNITASFDRRGIYVYTGNAKGKISVFRCNDLKLVASYRLGASSSYAVKTLLFARRGETFLVNSADRMIRVYDSRLVLNCGVNGDPQPVQKLQDLVNKTPWKTCSFSGDGEYVCAGSAKQYALYIWERNSGNLVKILHGTKGETLLDVVWHPVRPTICSIANGIVSLWSQSHVENWSAFAPDFKELDENVEYEERESEFDLDDEDRSVQENAERPLDDIDVDVVGVELPPAFHSSDEEDEDSDALWFLPIAPEVEDPEENPYMALLPPPSAPPDASTAAMVDTKPADHAPHAARKSLSGPAAVPPVGLKVKHEVADYENSGTDDVAPFLQNKRRLPPPASTLGLRPSTKARKTKGSD